MAWNFQNKEKKRKYSKSSTLQHNTMKKKYIDYLSDQKFRTKCGFLIMTIGWDLQNSNWIRCSLLDPSYNIMQCIHLFYVIASFFPLRFLDLSLQKNWQWRWIIWLCDLFIWEKLKLKNVFSACRYTCVLNGSTQHLAEEVGMGTTCSSNLYCIFPENFQACILTLNNNHGL